MRRSLRVEEAVTKYGESCVDRGDEFSHPRRAFTHPSGARSDVRRSQHPRTSTISITVETVIRRSYQIIKFGFSSGLSD